ncbi:MAG: SCO family protein, partial [Planctomycetaceae bacterium]
MNRFVLVFALALLPVTVCGQIVTEKPDGLADVGIVEHRGDLLPLDTTFIDSTGNVVRLGQYFDGRTPVILSFNYATCPMLCKMQLNGLVDGLRELDWNAGEKFRVVSISIDPSETPRQAAASKQKHLNA